MEQNSEIKVCGMTGWMAGRTDGKMKDKSVKGGI